MRITNEEFYKIGNKARGRNDKWQALVVLGGLLVVAIITAYSMPSEILDAAVIASTSSFPAMLLSWQNWLCYAPGLAYIIVCVALWEKAENQAIRFYRNVLRAVKILEPKEARQSKQAG